MKVSQVSDESPSDQQNEAPEILGSSNNCRKLTREDIEVVQNLIERCLQLYMNRNEVMNVLLHQARIEPGFTILVWQKLEEENADFFKAYYMRLLLKKQITVFNQLLEHQYCLTKSPLPPEVPLDPIQSRIQHISVDNLPMEYTIQHEPPILSIGHPQIDVVNGIPASDYFHPMQMSSGKEMVTDRDSAINSEMASSPASVVSDGQFSFTPEISDLEMNALALDSAYTSHVTSSEALLLGANYAIHGSEESQQPSCHIRWNSADLTTADDHGQLGSDILLDSPEHNDIVEEFLADTVPALDPQAEEKSQPEALITEGFTG